MWYEQGLSRGLLPDWLIRTGIRLQLKNKLKTLADVAPSSSEGPLKDFVDELKKSPIAMATQDANEQHYEVPAEFFELVLGGYLKYSSGYWPDGIQTLDQAEEAMLELYCERAQLKNGQAVLDLGCGWGSLSLFLARKYPESSILAVSNSGSQRGFIESQCRTRQLRNLNVVTADMNHFQTSQTFDRIVSIEMFEHMRNYQKLLSNVAGWMKPNGLLFIHIFTHVRHAYPFSSEDPNNWMAKYFFTGGLMPSEDLLLHFQDAVSLRDSWRVNGLHYQKTCEAWLRKMDQNKPPIMTIFKRTYGAEQAVRWWNYWRVFFMACAELFGYRQGEEWGVTHYLFEKQPVQAPVGRL